jgi:hypothetical protein
MVAIKTILKRDDQCQKLHHRPSRLHRRPPRLLNHCRRTRRRFQPGKGEILFCWRKQKPQRGFDTRSPRGFAVVGAFDFEITQIDFELPALVD